MCQPNDFAETVNTRHITCAHECQLSTVVVFAGGIAGLYSFYMKPWNLKKSYLPSLGSVEPDEALMVLRRPITTPSDHGERPVVSHFSSDDIALDVSSCRERVIWTLLPVSAFDRCVQHPVLGEGFVQWWVVGMEVELELADGLRTSQAEHYWHRMARECWGKITPGEQVWADQ